MLSGCDVGPRVRAMLGEVRPGHQFGSGKETAAQLDARLETQFGSGKETAAQLETHFGSGKETAAQVKGGRAGLGVSKPGCGGVATGERKKWPEGTVKGWCGNCGAEGGKGKQHNEPKKPCQAEAKELFLGSDWAD